MRWRLFLSSRTFGVLAVVVAVVMATGQAMAAGSPRVGGSVSASVVAGQPPSAAGAVVSVTPARVADSRVNQQIPGAVPALGTAGVQVTGQGGVPASGVATVVLNVTVVSPQTAGYITVWPFGIDRTNTSNLNFQAGQNIPNTVIVPVGQDGKIQLFNGSDGTVHLIVDVSGYTLSGTPTVPGAVVSVTPARIADSRTAQQIPGAVPALGTAGVQVTGQGGVPASGVAAVVLNVTVVSPQTAGYITVWPSWVTRTNTSNLNFQAGRNIPNTVIVPVGQDGKIQLFNGSAGTVHLLADVTGYTLAGDDPLTMLRFGASTPGGPLAWQELSTVAQLAGEWPSIEMSYKDFAQPAPIAELDAVTGRGAQPVITWEPWLWDGGVNQPAYSLSRIAAGDHDGYLRTWADALRAWGHPVTVRFGPEMNGWWYPWDEGVNGNAAGSFLTAWRHVHDVFTAAGANNVSWMWSPNVPTGGSVPLAGLYPGAGYVDVVALVGYNWGTSASWSAWTTPDALFGPGLTQLRSITPGKPIVIAETASAEAGGSKPDWIRDLVSYLDAQPDVTGFIWFQQVKETDWRFNSSAASAAAFSAALAARR